MIHILDNNLINKIAAGEVVERPASVLKELIENSLDAKVSFIEMKIKNGGIDFIEVQDDGIGMNKNDARLCVERHATSKIDSVEDLHSIITYGFRGEALAAISAVSKFNLRTKEKGALIGISLINKENGWLVEEVGCPEGTKIIVKDLFYNIPARKKFLKLPSTEFSHMLQIALNFALIDYDVRFKFSHNERIIFDYHRNAENGSELAWSKRVGDIIGHENFSNMIPFLRESGDLAIQGFISRPDKASSNKTCQYLFVNNRPVSNNIVHKAIYDGYKNLIPRESHPMFVIRLDIEPELVDVNVHPRKMEVKFLRQQDVFKAVETTIRETAGNARYNAFVSAPFYKGGQMDSTNKISNFKFSACAGRPISNEITNTKFQKLYQNFRDVSADKRDFYNSDKKGVKSWIGSSQLQSFNDAMFSAKKHAEEEVSWKLIGQVNSLYLVVETEDGLMLIDQHAAHERIVYDDIIKNMEKGNEKSQALLIPFNIDLSLQEMEHFKQSVELLREIGFEIEQFGEKTINIQAVPRDIPGNEIKVIVRGVIDDLLSAFVSEVEFDAKILEKIRNRIICYAACRSAIKAGDQLSLDEQINLVKRIMLDEVKSTCPHGRPIAALLKWEEIGKKFKRAL